ncbi:hypothetical protein XELAEV_18042965mg [Xenopus laevis]|uniref:Uncharacterized protein n=1 Tax=Xenopus laevis TaxID=8355 RepID=A0A974C549_XENLA|nr:hypothetical protein XELAEV_18042965mg [Xenopus laevis]
MAADTMCRWIGTASWEMLVAVKRLSGSTPMIQLSISPSGSTHPRKHLSISLPRSITQGSSSVFPFQSFIPSKAAQYFPTKIYHPRIKLSISLFRFYPPKDPAQYFPSRIYHPRIHHSISISILSRKQLSIYLPSSITQDSSSVFPFQSSIPRKQLSISLPGSITQGSSSVFLLSQMFSPKETTQYFPSC